jgi:hypothetical protein
MQVTFALHNRTGLIVSRHDVNMSVHTASALPSAKRLFFPGGFILLVDNFDVDIGIAGIEEYFIVNLRPPFRIESLSGQSKKLRKAEEDDVAAECLNQAIGKPRPLPVAKANKVKRT